MLLKSLVLSLFIVLSSQSAYLYSNENKCIDLYYYKNAKFYYVYSDDNETLHSTGYSNRNVIPGYFYDPDTQICEPKQILQDLQIDNNTYHSLLALSGLLIGFSFLFYSIFLVIQIARK